MAYSVVADLLLGDLIVSDSVDKAKFVSEAADEMDSKIGWLYETPIDLEPLPRHENMLLKQISNKMASGRLILTLDIAEEGSSLHAYGLRLLTEANNDLLLLANGDLDLSATKLPNAGQNKGNAPNLKNRDAVSAVEAFEDRFMTVWPPLDTVLAGWEPGG